MTCKEVVVWGPPEIGVCRHSQVRFRHPQEQPWLQRDHRTEPTGERGSRVRSKFMLTFVSLAVARWLLVRRTPHFLATIRATRLEQTFAKRCCNLSRLITPPVERRCNKSRGKKQLPTFFFVRLNANYTSADEGLGTPKPCVPEGGFHLM